MPRSGSASVRAADTYWILAREQIECLASPRRHDIVDRLVALGPCSVREIAPSVGLAPSAVYHHLRQLEAVGLIEGAGQRVVRRRTERLYRAVALRMRLARALERPAVRGPIRGVVAGLCRQMARDFGLGIERPEARIRGVRRNLGFFRLVGSPDPASLAEINSHLDRIAELLWTRRSARAPLVALGWTLAPIDRGVARARRRRRS